MIREGTEKNAANVSCAIVIKKDEEKVLKTHKHKLGTRSSKAIQIDK